MKLDVDTAILHAGSHLPGRRQPLLDGEHIIHSYIVSRAEQFLATAAELCKRLRPALALAGAGFVGLVWTFIISGNFSFTPGLFSGQIACGIFLAFLLFMIAVASSESARTPVTYIITNFRIIKRGKLDESFNFDSTAIKTSVLPVGKSLSVINFSKPQHTLSIVSRSLQQDLRFLPVAVGLQMATLRQSCVDDRFFDKELSAEQHKCIAEKLFTEEERVLEVIPLFPYEAWKPLILAVVVGLLSMAAFLAFPSLHSFKFGPLLALPLYVVMQPIKYYLLNKNSFLILTKSRAVRIAPNGRVRVVGLWPDCKLVERAGYLELSCNAQSFSFRLNHSEKVLLEKALLERELPLKVQQLD